MKRYLVPIAGVVLAFYAASCGVLLYPERVNQPHSDRLDPAIVLLDAAGLLIILVPGIVAFAVDFGTGTIWLPEDPGSTGTDDGAMRMIQVPVEELTEERIETAVKEHTGITIDLSSDTVQFVELEGPDALPGAKQQVIALNRSLRPDG